MNESTIKKENLRPLAMVIGLLCLMLAVWFLFQTILLIDTVHPSILKGIQFDGKVSDSFQLIMKAFGYLSIVLNLLLLFWFIIMRKYLSKGVWLTAVIGLAAAMFLSIANHFVNRLLPMEGNNGHVIYAYVANVIGIVYMVMISIAFFKMNRQFNDKLGRWAIMIGLLYLICLLFIVSSPIINVVLRRYYPIPYCISVIQKVNIGAAFVTMLRYLVMAIFFFTFVRRKEGAVEATN